MIYPMIWASRMEFPFHHIESAMTMMLAVESSSISLIFGGCTFEQFARAPVDVDIRDVNNT